VKAAYFVIEVSRHFPDSVETLKLLLANVKCEISNFRNSCKLKLQSAETTAARQL